MDDRVRCLRDQPLNALLVGFYAVVLIEDYAAATLSIRAHAIEDAFGRDRSDGAEMFCRTSMST